MQMDDRSSQILLKLLNTAGAIKIHEFAQMFKVSNRTIRYDLERIDDFLKFNKLPLLIRKPNVGVSCSESQKIKDKMFQCLGVLNNYYYNLSQKERVDIILSNLLQQRDFITIQYVSEKLMVSRSTVIKDLRKAKKWLEDRKLILVSIPKHGIKIIGEEKTFRKAAIELLSESIGIEKALDMVSAPLQTRGRVGIEGQIQSMFMDLDISFIEIYIQEAENELNTIFADDAYTSLVIHIAMAIKRIQMNKDIIMPDEELTSLEATREFNVAKDIAAKLEEKFNIQIPRDEIGYITVHLLGSSISQIKIDRKDNWVHLQLMTHEIIEEVSCKIRVDLTEDTQLFNGILDHLRPAFYRFKHDLQIKNPFLDELKTNYCQLFQIVSQGMAVVEKVLCKNISEDEVAYFTMHFAAALERREKVRSEKLNVLIVCGTGLGTAKLLYSKIQSFFDVNIIDTVAYHQVEERIQNHSIDLILTTIPIKYEKIPVIKVNPILTESDIETLRKYIKVSNRYDSELPKFLDIINRYCDIRNYSALVDELSRLLSNSGQENKRGVVQPMLKDILYENNIKLNVEVKNWEEAVKVGGELLESSGAIEHRYIDAMINAVKEIGPYIVIAPGIAMPHARPESGVKNIGMSFITLKDPVNFGNKDNDPVRIVVCICAIDHATHLKALSEMAQLLGDSKFLTDAKRAESKEDILKYIRS